MNTYSSYLKPIACVLFIISVILVSYSHFYVSKDTDFKVKKLALIEKTCLPLEVELTVLNIELDAKERQLQYIANVCPKFSGKNKLEAAYQIAGKRYDLLMSNEKLSQKRKLESEVKRLKSKEKKYLGFGLGVFLLLVILVLLIKKPIKTT